MKATLVNTLPFKLVEEKPGLQPYSYEIPAAPKFGQFSVFHLIDAFHTVRIPGSDDNAPPIKVPDPADKLAESLIVDFVSSNICVSFDPKEDGSITAPGLFWVEGHLSVREVAEKHIDKLTTAFKNTTNWFDALVKMGDDDWKRTQQHKSISDLQRKAASCLQLTRDWNVDPLSQVINKCPMCQVQYQEGAVLCSSCKFILDEKKYELNKARFVTA